MPIRYVKWITREMVRAQPGAIFVFGDNLRREGLGGQAKAMRGEPNAIGIATKRAPTMSESAFFKDCDEDRAALQADLLRVWRQITVGKTIYAPADGLGTGLSMLPEKAPELYAILLKFFREHSDPDHPCPWPDA
jgi:hypothetical protein